MDLPEFKWINTVLGNLETALSGTFHALKYRKDGGVFLAAFALRVQPALRPARPGGAPHHRCTAKQAGARKNGRAGAC
jgi:hypothetical protein